MCTCFAQSAIYHERMKQVRTPKSRRAAATDRRAATERTVVVKAKRVSTLPGAPRPDWAPLPPPKPPGAPSGPVTWKERPQVRTKSARERSASDEKLHMPLRLGEAPSLPEGDPDQHTMDKVKFDVFVAAKAEEACEEVERLMKEELAHPELRDPALPEEQAPAFVW